MTTLYGINEPEILHDDLQQCVLDHLEQMDEADIPSQIIVEHYRPRKIEDSLFVRIYEWFEESILEEYGDPDGNTCLPESVHKAWDAFVDVVKRDYQPWQCEPDGESTTVKTADYLTEEGK